MEKTLPAFATRTQTCASCSNFDDEEKNPNGMGVCKLNGPQVSAVIINKQVGVGVQQMMQTWSGWPPVKPTNWCKQYAIKITLQ